MGAGVDLVTEEGGPAFVLVPVKLVEAARKLVDTVDAGVCSHDIRTASVKLAGQLEELAK